MARAPATPVCRQGTPCTAPAAGTQLTFVQVGGVVRRVVAAKDGTYSLWLPPGDYDVMAATQTLNMVGRIEPQTVHVDSGRTRAVDFRIDTGLR